MTQVSARGRLRTRTMARSGPVFQIASVVAKRHDRLTQVPGPSLWYRSPVDGTRPHTRPRFEINIPMSPDDVGARVRAALDQGEGRVRGSVYKRVVQLAVVEGEIHFWSPHLDVSLLDNEDGTTQLFGRFAPRPQVWTGFVAAQAVCWFLCIGALMWGSSEAMLGKASVGWWLAALFALLGGVVYLTAYVGQSLGQEQMFGLRSFLDDALATPPPAAIASGDSGARHRPRR